MPNANARIVACCSPNSVDDNAEASPADIILVHIANKLLPNRNGINPHPKWLRPGFMKCLQSGKARSIITWWVLRNLHPWLQFLLVAYQDDHLVRNLHPVVYEHLKKLDTWICTHLKQATANNKLFFLGKLTTNLIWSSLRWIRKRKNIVCYYAQLPLPNHLDKGIHTTQWQRILVAYIHIINRGTHTLWADVLKRWYLFHAQPCYSWVARLYGPVRIGHHNLRQFRRSSFPTMVDTRTYSPRFQARCPKINKSHRQT